MDRRLYLKKQFRPDLCNEFSEPRRPFYHLSVHKKLVDIFEIIRFGIDHVRHFHAALGKRLRRSFSNAALPCRDASDIVEKWPSDCWSDFALPAADISQRQGVSAWSRR